MRSSRFSSFTAISPFPRLNYFQGYPVDVQPSLQQSPNENSKPIHAAGRNPGTERSIHSWCCSIREAKDPHDPRFTQDQSGGILAETGRSRSGVARIGSSAIEDLEMWLDRKSVV